MIRTKASIDDNLDIIIYLVTKFNDQSESYEFEDLLQVAFLGSLQAIKNYDAEIGPLRNYMFSSIRNHLIKFLKKESDWQSLSKLEIATPSEYTDDHHMLEFQSLLAAYKDKLLPMERKILDFKSRGYTRKDICGELFLSKNEYYSLLYSAIGKIRRHET
jgi:RNA polymerase sigma factor (sigma-70 family)